ncbi:MAG: hypothetical protein QOH05_2784, partial [Acetobacteraceae bacterium]|nr:hypothetical protein [Acetobacteraceae bacterium]
MTAIEHLGGRTEGLVARHRRSLFGLLVLLAAGSAALAWWITEPRPAFAEADAASLEQGGDPVRGKDVFNAADCASCHASPGQP